ncbi:MAG: NAD(P)-binding protein [Methylocella sp.]
MDAPTNAPVQPWIKFVGCFATRVTFYSQQVRALNLVHELLNGSQVPERGSIAIIGAGATGITAATALALARPQLKIDIFEKANILNLQRKSSSRHLRPHIYDWPAPTASQNDAGLPILNWAADTAENVASKIEREFKTRIHGKQNVKLRLRNEVRKVEIRDGGDYQLTVDNLDTKEVELHYYHWILSCVGFGLEKLLEKGNYSYWSPSLLDAPILTDTPNPLIFVSGNGDGGLIDFALAAFDALDHKAVENLILDCPDLEQAKSMLRIIEAEAQKQCINGIEMLNLFEAYNRIPLPNELVEQIRAKLRKGARIWFHTNRPYLFTLKSSILNRFIVFLITRAAPTDSATGDSRIRVFSNKKLGGDPLHDDMIVIEDEQPFKPHYRILRFGPEREKVREPFKGLFEDIEDTSLPEFSREAKTRFSELAANAEYVETRRRTKWKKPPTVKVRYFVYSLFSERIIGRKHQLGYPKGMVGYFSVTEVAGGRQLIDDGRVYYYFTEAVGKSASEGKPQHNYILLEFRGPWKSEGCEVRAHKSTEVSMIKWLQQNYEPGGEHQPGLYQGFFEFKFSNRAGIKGIFGGQPSRDSHFYDVARQDRIGRAYFEEICLENFEAVTNWLKSPDNSLQTEIETLISLAKSGGV